MKKITVIIPFYLFDKNKKEKVISELRVKESESIVKVRKSIEIIKNLPKNILDNNDIYHLQDTKVFETILYIYKMLEPLRRRKKLAFSLVQALSEDWMNPGRVLYSLLEKGNEVQERLYHKHYKSIMSDVFYTWYYTNILKTKRKKSTQNKPENSIEPTTIHQNISNDPYSPNLITSPDNPHSQIYNPSDSGSGILYQNIIKPFTHFATDFLTPGQTIESHRTSFFERIRNVIINILFNPFFIGHNEEKITDYSVWESLNYYKDILPHNVLISTAYHISKNKGEFKWDDFGYIIKKYAKKNKYIINMKDFTSDMNIYIECLCECINSYLIPEFYFFQEKDQKGFILSNLMEKLRLLDKHINYTWGWEISD